MSATPSNAKDDTTTTYRFLLKTATNNQFPTIQYKDILRKAMMFNHSGQVHNSSITKQKKKKASASEKDDEEDEEDDDKEIDLASSGEEDDAVSESETEESEDETKTGEERKAEAAAKQKTKKDVASNKAAVDEAWKGLKEASYVSRLDSIIQSIEQRERSLKNTLLTRPKTKQKADDDAKSKKGKGEHYEYDSDDSWIDDGEYEDFVEEAPQDPEFDPNIDQGFNVFDENATEEVVEVVEEEVSSEEEEEQTKKKPSPVKRKNLFNDVEEDVVLEEELELAFKALQNRASELGYDSSKTFKIIPHELDPELGVIAHLRTKYYPRGIPAKLTSRLSKVPGLDFTEKTIKDRLKSCLKVQERDNIQSEIENCKTELKECVTSDVRLLLNKRRDKNTKDGKTETIPTAEQLADMNHADLTKSFNDLDQSRYLWGNATKTKFKELVDKVDLWVTKTNEAGKEQQLDKEKEMKTLFDDIKNYWPRPRTTDLQKKYKDIVSPKEKKEKTAPPAASTSTSTAGGASANASIPIASGQAPATTDTASTGAQPQPTTKKRKRLHIKNPTSAANDATTDSGAPDAVVEKKKRKMTHKHTVSTTTPSDAMDTTPTTTTTNPLPPSSMPSAPINVQPVAQSPPRATMTAPQLTSPTRPPLPLGTSLPNRIMAPVYQNFNYSHHPMQNLPAGNMQGGVNMSTFIPMLSKLPGNGQQNNVNK
ncbi:MUC6 [Acrasis kona]|uniref:MUC6 n=1 Tax=Acrasis kona TaxID=1008807 RepID=A0AAW2ZDH3_9EUKA